MAKKEINIENIGEEINPEWRTCLIGKLSFCPKCGKEALLCDGIREVCTACSYQNNVEEEK